MHREFRIPAPISFVFSHRVLVRDANFSLAAPRFGWVPTRPIDVPGVPLCGAIPPKPDKIAQSAIADTIFGAWPAMQCGMLPRMWRTRTAGGTTGAWRGPAAGRGRGAVRPNPTPPGFGSGFGRGRGRGARATPLGRGRAPCVGARTYRLGRITAMQIPSAGRTGEISRDFALALGACPIDVIAVCDQDCSRPELALALVFQRAQADRMRALRLRNARKELYRAAQRTCGRPDRAYHRLRFEAACFDPNYLLGVLKRLTTMQFSSTEIQNLMAQYRSPPVLRTILETARDIAVAREGLALNKGDEPGESAREILIPGFVNEPPFEWPSMQATLPFRVFPFFGEDEERATRDVDTDLIRTLLRCPADQVIRASSEATVSERAILDRMVSLRNDTASIVAQAAAIADLIDELPELRHRREQEAEQLEADRDTPERHALEVAMARLSQRPAGPQFVEPGGSTSLDRAVTGVLVELAELQSSHAALVWR